jgi:hypothetical protein
MRTACLWHKFKDVRSICNDTVVLQKCRVPNCNARRILIFDRRIKDVQDILDDLEDKWANAQIVRA